MATSSLLGGKKRVDKESRYNQVKTMLTELFKDVPEAQMHLANGLIERLAFMQATIEDLERDIQANGTFELTKTRPRKFRERPVVKTYNGMIKNYTSTVKQLLDRLPGQKSNEEDDELLAFLRK